ncbi:MAG: SusC/RagA family TonB-linked outer membrane protein [Chlorobi bacterium]|nr:SusC/RagA family TonB-linked outer membrane protein [Chlorobiota bacterium]
MKTSQCYSPHGRNNAVSFVWLRYAFIFVILVFSVSSTVYAQEGNSLPVKEWFKIIQDKTGYRFFYNDDMKGLDKQIVLEGKIKEIKPVISELKRKTPFDYKITSDNLIVVVPVNSQKKPVTVTGQVTTPDDPKGLPGVNVYIKGTTTGTITDINGNYSIDVPDNNEILVFSFIGYDSQEIPINGRSRINVQLKSDSETLDEIVVTALNIERNKESLGYSITQVNNEEVSTVKQTNPINSLAGKVAGLQISSSPTGVDGSSRVVLRGISSLSQSNRPLIVIDGVPVSGGTHGGASEWGGTDRGDDLSDINPEDIETMSVLKGAGAAAIYGSQGANGVILITTKKGKKRKGLGISVNSNFMTSTPMVYPDLQTEYGQGGFGRYPTDTYNGISVTPGMDAIRNMEPWIWSWGSKLDGSLKEDWLGNMVPYEAQPNFYKDFYQTGITTINTVAFDGGNDKTTFRASLTQQNSKGMYPTNKMAKQNFNIHGTSQLSDKFSITAKLTYIHTKVHDRPYLAEDPANVAWALGVLPPNVQLSSLKDNMYNSEGYENWAWDGTSGNPYWALENKRNWDEKNRLQGLLVMNIDFTDKLKLMLRSGLDTYGLNSNEYLAEGCFAYKPLGTMSESLTNNLNINSDFLLSYKTPLGEDFNIGLSLGGQHRYSYWKGLSQWGSDWKIPDFYHISNLNSYGTGEWHGTKEALSVYTLGDISFKNYLYTDFTFRNDWSSTLPIDNNAYQFYSGNMSFLFTEAFNIHSNLLSKGKVRASVARVGNDTGPFNTYNYYSVSQTTLPYPIGGMSSQLTFPDFKPEITNSWEVGTNLKLLNNRIEIDFTYYSGKTHNQILSVELAPSSGYSTQKVNAGEVKNWGFESLISANLISSKDFRYDISLNFSRNLNEVISLSNDAESRVLLEAVSGFARVELRAGETYGSIYGYDYKRNDKGQKIVTDQGMAIKGEYKKLGDINPDLIGGLSNNLSWKNLKVRFLIDFQIGGEYYSQSRLYHDLMGSSKTSLEGREEWYSTHEGVLYGDVKPGTIPDGYIEDAVTEDGSVNDVPVQPMLRAVNTIWFQHIVTDYILEATNIRLRELSIGYDLPANWIANTFFKKVNITLIGRNLFFFYNASDDYDPESGFNSGSIGNAFELNPMPSSRNLGFNLTLNF